MPTLLNTTKRGLNPNVALSLQQLAMLQHTAVMACNSGRLITSFNRQALQVGQQVMAGHLRLVSECKACHATSHVTNSDEVAASSEPKLVNSAGLRRVNI